MYPPIRYSGVAGGQHDPDFTVRIDHGLPVVDGGLVEAVVDGLVEKSRRVAGSSFRSCTRLLRPHAQLVEPLHDPFHAAAQLRADCTGTTRNDLGAHDNPLAGHAGHHIHKCERYSLIRIGWHCGT
jgi:hypothetical protein